MYNMKLPYGCYALNYVLHLCTLYIRNGLSRAASLTLCMYLYMYREEVGTGRCTVYKLCMFLYKHIN